MFSKFTWGNSKFAECENWRFYLSDEVQIYNRAKVERTLYSLLLKSGVQILPGWERMVGKLFFELKNNESLNTFIFLVKSTLL